MTRQLSTATSAGAFGYSPRTSTTTAVTETARPFRGRRLSWREFYSLRPDLKPDNDNSMEVKDAA